MAIDPTRTTLLRRKWISDINKRVRKLKGDINRFLIRDDSFGLAGPEKMAFNAERQKYIFQTDPAKMESFKGWFQDQVDAGILAVDGRGDPWTNKYVDSAYRRGVVRAYTDARKEALVDDPIEYEGGKSQFLRDAFASPEAISKIQLIHTRSFDQLKGYTASMSQSTSRVLSDGIAHGWGAGKIARELNSQIDMLTKRRAWVIARTETVHAHAEGQLDSFERLGIKEVGLEVEWSTAGDDLVCPLCLPREGEIMTVQEARGEIPFHPNCRCAWIPAKDEALRKKEEAKKEEAERVEREEYEESVRKFEEGIVDYDYEVAGVYSEAGDLLFQKSGSHNAVVFTTAEVKKMEGAILSHNHPGKEGNSFSGADIFLMKSSKAKEIRAVTRKYRYRHVARLTEKGKDISLEKLKGVYKEEYDGVFSEFKGKISAGEMTIDQASQQHYHEIWTRVSERGFLDYRRETDD